MSADEDLTGKDTTSAAGKDSDLVDEEAVCRHTEVAAAAVAEWGFWDRSWRAA